MKELVESFLDIEDRFMDMKVGNLCIWPYIRTEVFRMVEHELTNNDFVPVFKRQSVVESTDWARDEVCSGPKYESLFIQNLTRKSILIITEKNRFVEIDGKKVCPVTSSFENLFPNQTITICNEFITGGGERNESIKENALMCEDDRVTIDYGSICVTKKVEPSEDEVEKISFDIKVKTEKLLSLELRDEFLDSLKQMILYVCSFTGYTNFYGRMIDAVNPEVVIVSSYYCIPHGFFVAEARKRNIPVFEIQHGTIGDEHFAYNSYLNMGQFVNTPDYLLCYGEPEMNSMRFSIGKDRIIPVGNLFLNEVSDKYKDRFEREQGSILLVAFNIDNDNLVDLAVRIKDKVPDRHVTYRFHPIEKRNDKVIDILKTAGVELSMDFRVSVYDYLAVSDIVIGTKSTVLKEAEVFGNRIYKLDEKSDIELIAEDIASEKYNFVQHDIENYFVLSGKELAKEWISKYLRI